MAGYQIALTLHLLSLLLATAAAALSTFGAWRLRRADNVPDATSWLAFIGKVVRAFPVAIVGLLASGAYMTHQRSMPLPRTMIKPRPTSAASIQGTDQLQRWCVM